MSKAAFFCKNLSPCPRRSLVTILEEEPSDTRLPQDRYPLRGTSVQYQNPLEPVAEQE